MKIFLSTSTGEIIPGFSWNSKAPAEAWVRGYLKWNGGLEYRAGFVFKAYNTKPLQMVYSNGKVVSWRNIIPTRLDTSNESDFKPFKTVNT